MIADDLNERINYNSQASSVITTITPQVARDILEKRNNSNRKINKNTVKNYARLMLENKWMLNGDSIIFDESGRLINGQHRLHAVILSNMPITTFVVKGVKNECFATYDQGNKRQFYQFHKGKNSIIYQTILRLLYCYEKNKNLTRSYLDCKNVSIVDLNQINQKYPDVEDFLQKYTPNNNLLGSKAAYIFAYYLCRPHDSEKADDFFIELKRAKC